MINCLSSNVLTKEQTKNTVPNKSVNHYENMITVRAMILVLVSTNVCKSNIPSE